MEEDIGLVQHMEILNVSMMRLYDVMSALLDEQAPEKWKYLSELHESGGLHNGPPHMNEDPWRENED